MSSSPRLFPCGKHGLLLPRLGLGTMGMSAFYVGTHAKEYIAEGLKTIDRSVELGFNHLDTAWIYKSNDETGAEYHNETLVGEAIKKHGRENLIIATKFGIDFSNTTNPTEASEEAIRKQLGESLARLGTTYVDLYYQHRQDPTHPIEEVARVLNELRKEGKIKYIGFSEVTASELRRAAAVCPVSAIQMEYSLVERGIEKDIIPTARELGVGIVAYSPLGRGLLGRRFTAKDQLESSDFRTGLPILEGEVGKQSFESAERLAAIAARKNISAATLALAWLLSKGEDVFPIPGSKVVERLEQNVAAANVVLTPEEVAEVEAAVPPPAASRLADLEVKMNWSWEKRA